MRRWARSPSFVTRISPVLSASSRPTGYSRAPRDGTRSTTVRRPCVSRRSTARPGLVHHEDHPLLGALEERPVDGHAAVDVDVAGRIGDLLAGDRHPAGADDLLRGTPRRDSGVGEELGEAHAYDGRMARPEPFCPE